MAAALGLAALGAAAGVGVARVAADAARRVSAGESAADERSRRRGGRAAGGEGGSAASPPQALSLSEALSDLFGGGHPASWLLPPWHNDDKED
jgi:hypothetical protein